MEILTQTLDKEQATKLEKAAFVLKTVANPLRLSIIYLLQDREHITVTEICAILDAEQSLISHHLLSMREKGILNSTKEGRKVLYSLKFRDVVKVIECLDNCEMDI
ncbi:MAG: winged helix-turn-helix transcriptional regulator [Bacteroidia bacterium]|nr:winged helix-turn-helix transcriptional regulator [Bacteroidia bacterium]NNM16254.1 winged helix-turn-helix transcriptional regulator [Bacteroidia bacterium]